MRSHALWSGWISVGLLTAWPRVARADSAADNAAADALFRDARKLLSEKKYDQACPKFQESLNLSKRLGTLLNLATCHEKQGKTASAWTEFNQAVALARQEHSERRERYADHHAHELEARLARVTFVVPADLKGASLKLDDNEIGSGAWGTPLPVDPGSHRIQVSAPGKKSWSTQITIKAQPGTTKVQVPELETKPAAEPSAETVSAQPALPKPEHDQNQTPTPSHIGHTLGWVALGVGVVGVGVGSYFGLRTLSKKSDADSHCGSAIGQSDANLCDQQGVDLRSQAKSAATLSTISFAVGAVGIGAGIVLLLTGRSKSKTSAEHFRMQPAVGPRGGMLIVDGTL